MIFSTLLATVLALPAKRDDSSLPSTCKVLPTLFVQCSHGGANAPTLYPPSCQLDVDGYVSCCAVTPEGVKTTYCAASGLYSDTGCKVLDTTLQLECRNSGGGISLASPYCSGSSDGSSECCARHEDGSISDQCIKTPPSTEQFCLVFSDLTTQCTSSNGTVWTPPHCETTKDYRKCCSVYQNGTESGSCEAVA